MSDLIRRDDLLDLYKVKEEYKDYSVPLPVIIQNIKDMPAVDAVEVVRCSQCKYWESMNNGSWMNKNRTDGCCRVLMKCRLAERYNTEKDHFCCYGKRREDNEID